MNNNKKAYITLIGSILERLVFFIIVTMTICWVVISTCYSFYNKIYITKSHTEIVTTEETESAEKN